MVKEMKKRWITILLMGMVCFILYWWLFLNQKNDKPPATDRSKTELSVKVLLIKAQDSESAIYSVGNLLPNESVILMPEVSGRIQAIGFEEGQIVKTGDLLVKISDTDLQAQLLKLEHRKKLAADKEYRQRMLLENNGISQQEYDIVLNDLNLILDDIHYTRAMIEKTEIRAPFSGKTGLRKISSGSYVSVGTEIASLVNAEIIKIETQIPEEYASQISRGDSLEFQLKNSKIWYRAMIYAVEPQVNPNTASLLIKASISNKRDNLLPGLSVDIRIISRSEKPSIFIPSWSLIPDIEGQKVFLCRNGKVEEKRVAIGHRDSRRIEVTDGLVPGDTLIISAILQLRSQLKVKIEKIETLEIEP